LPTNNLTDDLSVYLARLAVVDHFDQAYGKNVTRIEAWQELCRDVGAEVGKSITQCKKVSGSSYISHSTATANQNRI
jgi:hypothetical protein